MEIHRPKPWHGWRELAKEIGVITIGIAIALTGEQALEWLHRRQEVAEAREVLRSEIADNAAAARFTLGYERCISAVVAVYVAWADGGPHPPLAQVPPIVPPGTAAWDIVKGGAAARMPLKERLAYSRFYNDVERFRANFDIEFPVLLQLAGEFPKKTLTAAEAQHVLQAANQARLLNSVQSLTSRGLLSAAKAIGVEPTSLPAQRRDELEQFCAAHGVAARFE